MLGRSVDRDEIALFGEQCPDDAGVLGGDGDDGAAIENVGAAGPRIEGQGSGNLWGLSRGTGSRRA